MIIVRVPLRISFMGGGSDLPAFYARSPGRVISMAIDRYVFMAVNEKFDGKYRISYSVTEIVDAPHEVKNTRVRAALERFGVEKGLEIVSVADVPSHGTGLGSSSSFSVALMRGLSEFVKHPMREDKHALAEAACHMEMDMLGEQIGKQDQYAAAFGGLNVIDFTPSGVKVSPIKISEKRLGEFISHLIVFYAGGARSAARILGSMSKGFEDDRKKFAAQKEMVGMVAPFKTALVKGDFKECGALLHAAWGLKKKTSDLISNEGVDAMYALGRKHGAWGGKLLGAGGGGFMLFIAPPAKHPALRKAFAHHKELPVGIDREGSKVIFNRYA